MLNCTQMPGEAGSGCLVRAILDEQIIYIVLAIIDSISRFWVLDAVYIGGTDSRRSGHRLAFGAEFGVYGILGNELEIKRYKSILDI